jgi:transposase-like protein
MREVQKKGDRALGPYRYPKDGSYPGHFLVTIIYAEDSVLLKKQKPFPFSSPASEAVIQKKAQLYADRANAAARLVQNKTVWDAWADYVVVLSRKKKPSTIATKTFRFRAFFPEQAWLLDKHLSLAELEGGRPVYPRTMLLSDLSFDFCQLLLARLETAPPARRIVRTREEKRAIVAEYRAAVETGVWGAGVAVARKHGVSKNVIAKWMERDTPGELKPVAGDTVHGTLVDMRAFLKWCVKSKLLRSNPLADLRPELALNEGGKGKQSLTLDEQEAWAEVAYKLAEDDGDEGAAAGLVVLRTGIRATQVITRVARDVDAGGAILRCLTFAKGVRSELLQPVEDERLRNILLSLKLGKDPFGWLYPHPDDATRHRHKDWVTREIRRICRLAGVPDFTHAHGMRGSRMNQQFVDAGLGEVQAKNGHRHGSDVTKRSYLSAEAIFKRRQRVQRHLMAIAGGK